MLGIPHRVVTSNGLVCSGEYAMALMLYRLHYPSTLAMLQTPFGRTYDQLSRIFNKTIDIVYTLHHRKVRGNLSWYRDRFDMYRDAISAKIASLPIWINTHPGNVPVEVNNVFAFLDGHAREICRPHGHNNAQNAFWNGYYHMHLILWIGLSFPDGMIVLDGPVVGGETDATQWRDSELRDDLAFIMNWRVNNGLDRLKAYADKIYHTDLLVTAAYSRRNGHLWGWMHRINLIMSRVRVAVEWSFGALVEKWKLVQYFRGHLLQRSPVAKQFIVAGLLLNSFICLNGGQHSMYYGNLMPPTLDEYYDQ